MTSQRKMEDLQNLQFNDIVLSTKQRKGKTIYTVKSIKGKSGDEFKVFELKVILQHFGLPMQYTSKNNILEFFGEFVHCGHLLGYDVYCTGREANQEKQCSFRLTNIVFSHEYWGRFTHIKRHDGEDIDSAVYQAFWKDVHATFMDPNCKKIAKLAFADEAFRNCELDLSKIVEHNWKTLAAILGATADAYSRALVNYTRHDDEHKEFFDFCNGELELLYVHLHVQRKDKESALDATDSPMASAVLENMDESAPMIPARKVAVRGKASIKNVKKPTRRTTRKRRKSSVLREMVETPAERRGRPKRRNTIAAKRCLDDVPIPNVENKVLDKRNNLEAKPDAKSKAIQENKFSELEGPEKINSHEIDPVTIRKTPGQSATEWKHAADPVEIVSEPVLQVQMEVAQKNNQPELPVASPKVLPIQKKTRKKTSAVRKRKQSNTSEKNENMVKKSMDDENEIELPTLIVNERENTNNFEHPKVHQAMKSERRGRGVENQVTVYRREKENRDNNYLLAQSARYANSEVVLHNALYEKREICRMNMELEKHHIEVSGHRRREYFDIQDQIKKLRTELRHIKQCSSGDAEEISDLVHDIEMLKHQREKFK